MFYTVTPLHRYTVTPLHRFGSSYTVTLLCACEFRCNVTPLHRYTETPGILGYTGLCLHRFALGSFGVMLSRYTVTPLDFGVSLTVTPLHRYVSV